MQVIAPDLDTVTSARAGERKLGQCSFRPESGSTWEEGIAQAVKARVRFVIVGVPEDIGVRANLGVVGARDGWQCALAGIANVQANRFLPGGDVWIAGAIDCGELNARAELLQGADGEAAGLRALVAVLDTGVSNALLPLFRARLHPIVIGGGNNNSLPILRALSAVHRESRPDSRIHVLNCDPHADFRSREGRHSGNPFRYALEEGLVDRYFALLLHKNYNGEEMLAAMDRARAQGCLASNWYDDVLSGAMDLDRALEEAIAFVAGGDAVGLELDCDAIAGFPTSAYTPSGLGLDQARRLMLLAARRLEPSYLHLSEAAPSRTSDGSMFARKALALLVTDHLRAMGSAGCEAEG